MSCMNNEMHMISSIDTSAHACIHTCMNDYMCTHTYLHMHVHKLTQAAHKCTPTSTPTYKYTHTTHTHTYTRTHTKAYTLTHYATLHILYMGNIWRGKILANHSDKSYWWAKIWRISNSQCICHHVNMKILAKGSWFTKFANFPLPKFSHAWYTHIYINHHTHIHIRITTLMNIL